MHGYIGLRGTIFGFNGVSYKAKLAKGKHSWFSRLFTLPQMLSQESMAVSIGNISIQSMLPRIVFPRMTNFLSNHRSFLLKSFALYGITNHKILFLKDHFFMKINLQ